ncbi:MAG: hypothetical protein ACTHU0_03890 [Kofleriaceae bacterium]
MVVLVRELGVDEVALVGALRKQSRVPLLDPAEIQVDPDALRQVSRDVCARLRVLPFGLAADGGTKVLRLAMADPTDTTAAAEIEQLTQSEIDVSALPLSAIEELVDKGYRQLNTAVVSRPGRQAAFITSRGAVGSITEEISVTAQIPLSQIPVPVPEDLEVRVTALVQVLTRKGLITEAELAEALKKLQGPTGT